MKKVLLPAIFSAFTLMFSGCEKQLEIPVNFDYTGAKAYFTIPASDQLTYQDMKTVYFNADSLSKANKFDLNLVKSITIKRITFTLKDTSQSAPYSFNIIKDYEGFIGVPAMGRTLIEKADLQQNSPNEIEIKHRQEDIKDLVLNSKGYEMSIRGALTDTLKHPIRIEANITYQIKAAYLGKK